MGELGQAREHYQAALALDPTNRIAERNISRLRMLLAEAGKKTIAAKKTDKAPVSIFVEETGKTGFAHLIDLADPKQLAQVNPGDSVELAPDGPRLEAKSNGLHIGYVEPRVAARLLKLDRRRQQVHRRRHVDRRARRAHHHSRDVPGSGQLRQGLVPDSGQGQRPAAVHQGHAHPRGDGSRGRAGARRGRRRDRGHRPTSCPTT